MLQLQKHEIGRRNDEGVQVFEERETSKQERRSTPAPAPGNFGEEDRRLTPNGAKAVTDWSGRRQGPKDKRNPVMALELALGLTLRRYSLACPESRGFG